MVDDRDYKHHETSEGLEIDCLHCEAMLPFTRHATLEEIRRAKLQHLKQHNTKPQIKVIDESLVAIDNASVYLEFSKNGREIALSVPSLNALVGRAGAWIWKFDGEPANAEWLKVRLTNTGPNGQVAEPMKTILNCLMPS